MEDKTLKEIEETIKILNEQIRTEEDRQKKEDLMRDLDFMMDMRLSCMESLKEKKQAELIEEQKNEVKAKVENLKTQKDMMKFDILSKLNPMSMMGGLLSFRASQMHEEGINRRFQQQMEYEDKGVIPSPNMRKYF